MKCARRFVLSLLILLFAGTVSAQDGLVVMSVKGKVEAKQAAKGARWQPVKVGEVLGPTHTVRTSFASYVKLMTAGNRLISVDQNKTVKISKLASAVTQSKDPGASASLLAYAARQVKQSREQSDEPVYGAVRGSTEVFSAVFPKNYVMTTEPLFEWVDADNAGTYQLILLDDSFDIVARHEVTDHRLRYVADARPALAEDRQYYWRITRLSDGMESDIQAFRVLPADTIAAVRAELLRLDEELGNMGADSVTLHLIRAIYFEKRGLYSDAFREFKETIRLAPEVPEYREMLRGLLFRMRLYAEEEYLLE
ncbi:MAG: hypothetical protein RBU27_07165 [Bacteroidota bacterium]|jgi:hypothetical protein|nr:hypothetical protein [Bacteroidota bacterium]